MELSGNSAKKDERGAGESLERVVCMWRRYKEGD